MVSCIYIVAIILIRLDKDRDRSGDLRGCMEIEVLSEWSEVKCWRVRAHGNTKPNISTFFSSFEETPTT